MSARHGPTALAAVALDAAAILAFALAGRREHEGATTVANVLGVAAPFLLGGAAGWVVARAFGRAPASWSTALIVWSATLVVGMLARRFAWDRGTAPSFVVVAALVLGLSMFGWRGISVLVARRQQIRSSAPPSKADR